MSQNNRKDALLDSAEDLIQRMGSNAMSYQHLSKEVGIRKASIHYHFPHKEDLVLALQHRCEQSYHERYESIVHGPGTAIDKLIVFADVFASTVKSGKLCVATMLSAEYENLGPDSRDALKRTTEKTLALITEVLVQGAQKGEIHPDAATPEMAYAYFSFLKGGHLLARSTQDINTFKRAAAAFSERLRP